MERSGIFQSALIFWYLSIRGRWIGGGGGGAAVLAVNVCVCVLISFHF